MPQPKVPPTERINSSFKKLTSITPELHSAAKELSKTIDQFNTALEPLSLRVPAWHTISHGEDQDPECLEFDRVWNSGCPRLPPPPAL